MPKAIKDLLSIKARGDGKENVFKSQQKDNPKQFYAYDASKNQLQDDAKLFYKYGASKNQLQDNPKLFYKYGASKNQLQDNPKLFYKYGASKNQLQDNPKLFYKYGASKNQLQDNPKLFYRYGASKNQLQDNPKLFYKYGASKNQLKDNTKLFYRYGASKNQLQDNPKLFYRYGASKNQLQDNPKLFYKYGASKNQLKDNTKPFYAYGASKNQQKDNTKQFYAYGASKNQVSKNHLNDNPIAKLLFLEKDLQQYGEMKLCFMKDNQKKPFLPKNVSDSIPFSSKDLPVIYNKFSINPDSMVAELMKQTLSLCEHKGIEGEEIFCATSLESMVDFCTAKLGGKVKALSTEVNGKESTPSQKYKIELVRKFGATKSVVCHSQNYAYAVFYCHISVGIRSYAVSLEGEDGTKVKSVAVCHTDTSKWDPKHLAFQLLKITPGTVPVCHFLPEDHVLWVPYN
ncbi:putative BURP domain-containing protein [Helianthus debilis subsp. tardiflorus]